MYVYVDMCREIHLLIIIHTHRHINIRVHSKFTNGEDKVKIIRI